MRTAASRDRKSAPCCASLGYSHPTRRMTCVRTGDQKRPRHEERGVGKKAKTNNKKKKKRKEKEGKRKSKTKKQKKKKKKIVGLVRGEGLLLQLVWNKRALLSM